MELITKEQRRKMLENGLKTKQEHIDDHWPVVKVFTPDGACTWLLSELDPDEPDIAFGLCDLGLGFPELGYVSMSEFMSVRGKLGLPVERDLYFKPTKSIVEYSEDAHTAGRIVEVEFSLEKYHYTISEEFADEAESIFTDCGDICHYSEVLFNKLVSCGWPTYELTAVEFEKQANEAEKKAKQSSLNMNPAQLIGTINALVGLFYDKHAKPLQHHFRLDK